MLTDALSSCPALTADTLAVRSGVYAYEFSDPDPPNDFGVTFSFPLGDAHSTELQYVFGKIPSRDVTPPFTAAQFALSAQMMRYWARFAATGNPNGDGLWAGGQDDGEVGQVYGLVQCQQPGRREAVAGLEDQGGGQVTVTEHDVTGGPVGPDLGVEVMVAVGRDQAGQRVPVDLVDKGAGQRAYRASRRLGGDVDRAAPAA